MCRIQIHWIRSRRFWIRIQCGSGSRPRLFYGLLKPLLRTFKLQPNKDLFRHEISNFFSFLSGTSIKHKCSTQNLPGYAYDSPSLFLLRYLSHSWLFHTRSVLFFLSLPLCVHGGSVFWENIPKLPVVQWISPPPLEQIKVEVKLTVFFFLLVLFVLQHIFLNIFMDMPSHLVLSTTLFLGNGVT